jgi:hypothetical protein
VNGLPQRSFHRRTGQLSDGTTALGYQEAGCTARSSTNGAGKPRTASLPRHTRGATTTKSTRSARYGHAVAVVKSRRMVVGGLRGPPASGKAPRIGSASEIQPAEPEMTNSSYTDKAERRTIHASSISKAERLSEAHLTRPKSRGHRSRDSATHYHGGGLHEGCSRK